MEISVTIDDKAVQSMLHRLQERVGNMSAPMAKIGVFYERWVGENFAAQASPDGKPWARLSQTTMMLGLSNKGRIGKKGGLTTKSRKYIQGKRILWEHGDLAGSIHSSSTKDSVTIGSSGSIKYAAIHQFGGMAGRGRKVNIPARPYLAVNSGTGLELAERDRVRILDIIREYLAEG